jgi:hypothetical protein
MKLFLFSDDDYDDGNAIGVVAESLEEAVAAAMSHARGFVPGTAGTKTEVRELTALPVVFSAESYYRPDLAFCDAAEKGR